MAETQFKSASNDVNSFESKVSKIVSRIDMLEHNISYPYNDTWVVVVLDVSLY